MGEPILIYGKSGCGKSRSLINFNEDEIFLVNVEGKRLPFPKKFKYELKVKDPSARSVQLIKEKIANMPTHIAVIDDAGYLMTNQFMAGHRGGNQFDLFNDIADSFWSLLRTIKTELPDDDIVYIILHEQTSDNTGETKLRTIGKLLDDKVCIEGMCTVVLRATKDDSGYYFLTQNSGADITKSPEGMLDEKELNDLKAIDTKIRNFWGMKPSSEAKKKDKKEEENKA